MFFSVFPYYLSIGVTADQFWHGDPSLLPSYRQADTLRKQRISNEQWMQGLYIYEAFSVVVGNALREKGAAPHEYRPEPIRMIPLTKEEKAEEDRKKVIAYFNRFANDAGLEALD